MMRKPLGPLVVITACAVGFAAALASSWHLATVSYDTDFPVLYRAGRVVIEFGLTDKVYSPKTLASIPVPESISPQVAAELRYVWPLAGAGLLGAIAWMPYFQAKTVMVLANILGYVLALHLFARGTGASRGVKLGVAVAGSVWLPFIENLRFAQVNGLLCLLLAAAAVAARNGRAVGGAAAIVAASGIKVFPLPIAAFLGVANWRIPVLAGAGSLLLLAIQPMQPWLDAMTVAVDGHRSLPYEVLGSVASAGPLVYSIILLLAALAVAYRGRRLGPEWLVAFGVTTVLLASPMAEYYHLTLAILGLVFLAVTDVNAGRTLAVPGLPALLILCAPIFDGATEKSLAWVGLLALWLLLARCAQAPSWCANDRWLRDRGILPPSIKV